MSEPGDLSPTQRRLVLAASFLALLFDGVELGLMPVASLSVSQSLLGVLSVLDGGTFTADQAWAASPKLSTLERLTGFVIFATNLARVRPA